MVSPDRSSSRARLRDKLCGLDCLDLVRHSSSLLSPSLYSELDVASQEFPENDFPFQVSPADSFTRPAGHTRKASGTRPVLSNGSMQSPSVNEPLASMTNIIPRTDVQPTQPDAQICQTPIASSHQTVAPNLSRTEVMLCLTMHACVHIQTEQTLVVHTWHCPVPCGLHYTCNET